MKLSKGTYLIELSNDELTEIAFLLKGNIRKHIEGYDIKHIKIDRTLITDNELINNKFDMMIKMFYMGGYIKYADDTRKEFKEIIQKRIEE